MAEQLISLFLRGEKTSEVETDETVRLAEQWTRYDGRELHDQFVAKG